MLTEEEWADFHVNDYLGMIREDELLENEIEEQTQIPQNQGLENSGGEGPIVNVNLALIIGISAVVAVLVIIATTSLFRKK